MSLIYGLFDPVSGECRYIGTTTKTLQDRLRGHIIESKIKNTHKCQWIKSIDFKPEIVELDIVNDAFYWEKWYIGYFKSIGCRLTNLTEGGENPPIKKRTHPIGHGKKLREKWKDEHPDYWKKYHKEKMKSGFYETDEYKAKKRIWNKRRSKKCHLKTSDN